MQKYLSNKRVWLLSCSFVTAYPVCAQNPTNTLAEIQASTIEIPDLSTADEETVQQAWKELRVAIRPLELGNPQAASDVYRKFFDSGANRYHSVGMPLTQRVIRLYINELGEYDKALELVNWALTRYNDIPGIADFSKAREELRAIASWKQANAGLAEPKTKFEFQFSSAKLSQYRLKQKLQRL
jgi:hypothetical protein